MDSLKFEDEITIEEYCWLTWTLVGWLNWEDIFYIPAISLEKWGRTKTASLDLFWNCELSGIEPVNSRTSSRYIICSWRNRGTTRFTRSRTGKLLACSWLCAKQSFDCSYKTSFTSHSKTSTVATNGRALDSFNVRTLTSRYEGSGQAREQRQELTTALHFCDRSWED